MYRLEAGPTPPVSPPTRIVRILEERRDDEERATIPDVACVVAPSVAVSISVGRTVVVRVHNQLDAVGCAQLDRILSDLIGSHGIADLLVDLSHAGRIDRGLKDVLDQASEAVEKIGGTIEVLTPPAPGADLLELIEDIPAFAPVDPARSDDRATLGPSSPPDPSDSDGTGVDERAQ